MGNRIETSRSNEVFKTTEKRTVPTSINALANTTDTFTRVTTDKNTEIKEAIDYLKNKYPHAIDTAVKSVGMNTLLLKAMSNNPIQNEEPRRITQANLDTAFQELESTIQERIKNRFVKYSTEGRDQALNTMGFIAEEINAIKSSKQKIATTLILLIARSDGDDDKSIDKLKQILSDENIRQEIHERLRDDMVKVAKEFNLSHVKIKKLLDYYTIYAEDNLLKYEHELEEAILEKDEKKIAEKENSVRTFKTALDTYRSVSNLLNKAPIDYKPPVDLLRDVEAFKRTYTPPKVNPRRNSTVG